MSGRKEREKRAASKSAFGTVFVYDVVLLHRATGEPEQLKYGVHWDPEKVDAMEVATACAIEHNVLGSPRDSEGNPADPVEPISAALAA